MCPAFKQEFQDIDEAVDSCNAQRCFPLFGSRVQLGTSRNEEFDNVKVVSFGLKKMVPKMTRKPVKESFNIPLHN